MVPRLISALLTGLSLLAAWPLSAVEYWTTDLAAAQARAQAEGKSVLIHFSGSDWCGWCMKLRKEVFFKKEFDAYAQSNLVLVAIDFPKHKAVSTNSQAENQRIADKFQVQGLPTLVLLDSEGGRLGTVNYAQGGAKAFLAELDKLRNPPEDVLLARARGGSNKLAPKNGTPSTQPAGLTLQRITGPKKKRQALINDHSFAAGETATVMLAQGRVRIQCLEIRNDSVVISINGQKERRELKLARGT